MGAARTAVDSTGGERLEGFGCPVPTDRRSETKNDGSDDSPTRSDVEVIRRKFPGAKLVRARSMYLLPAYLLPAPAAYLLAARNKKAVGARAFRRHVPNDSPRWTGVIIRTVERGPDSSGSRGSRLLASGVTLHIPSAGRDSLAMRPLPVNLVVTVRVP